MRLVWVPQWTILPMIMEDQRIASDNGSRGRLPSRNQPVESVARSRPSDSGNQADSRMYLSFPSANFTTRAMRDGCWRLTVAQKKDYTMNSMSRTQLLSSKTLGLTLSVLQDSSHPIKWADDSHTVPTTWPVWLERYPTTTIRPIPKCHHTNNTNFKGS